MTITISPLPNAFGKCKRTRCDGYGWAEVKVKVGKTAAKPMCKRCASITKSQVETISRELAERKSILCPDCKSEGPVFKCARCSDATPTAKAQHEAWKRGEFSFAPYVDEDEARAYYAERRSAMHCQ
jgi:hypothetical protein